MIELALIEGFDWDDGNQRKSAEKHAVSASEAEQVFFNLPLRLLPHPRHSASEVRYYALGRTNSGRMILVSFTLRKEGKLIRVISARDMHRKERVRYEKEA